MSPPRNASGSSRPEHDVGVGDCRLGATTSVARGTGLGTRRLRPHLEQAELIDPSEAAAAGADLDEVDRRHRHREARTLLEAVDAGDLERVRELRLAIVDQARLGGGAAHVEAQQTILAEPTGEPRAGERTGRRTRLDEPDRRPRRVVGRHDTAVRQHHQDRATESLGREPLLQLVEIRPDHRHRGRIARRGDHSRVLADLR